MNCDERLNQLNMLIDGELPVAELPELTAHLATCQACAQELVDLADLRAALSRAIPQQEISPNLLGRIDAVLKAETAPIPRRPAFIQSRHLRGFILGATAAAIAATIMLTWLGPPKNTVDLAGVRDAMLRTSLASNMAASAMIAPQVAGFEITNARSDIIAGHATSVLTYHAAQGTITLCIWKANGEAAHSPITAHYRGTNILYWNDGTNEYWVAANLPMNQIEVFANRLQGKAG